MPQPLLARCAGSLLAQGHSVLVVDEGSAERLACAGTSQLAAVLAGAPREHSPPGWRPVFDRRAHRAGDALHRLRRDRIARAIAAHAPREIPRLAAIQIPRRKDVPDAQGLAAALKARDPGVHVAVVGDLPNGYAHFLLAGIPEFDTACTGPVEPTLARLAHALENRDHWPRIPGLVYRAGRHGLAGGRRWPVLPPEVAPANYHPAIYPALLDAGKLRLFTLPHSTGLDHTGHYRGEGERGPVHVRDARHLRAEIMEIHELYGARAFHVTGPHTPRGAILQLASACRSLPFDIAYGREAHVHELDADLLSALAASGCRALGFSLLTGSQRLLSDFYGENWTISEVETCFRACRLLNFHRHARFVFPCPADDYHSRAETFRLLRRCQPDSANFSLPALLPGSAWYQHARAFQFGVAPHKLERWLTRPPRGGGLPSEAAHLPYAMHGQPGGAVATRFHAALAELDELAIPRHTSGTAGLIAYLSRGEPHETPLAESIEAALLHLDLPRLHDTAEVFNRRATAPIRTAGLAPPDAIRKAVGG